MSAEAEGRVAAERFRTQHRLGVQALGDLVAVIERTTSIDVAILDAEPNEHGLTMRDPVRGAVFIAVARTRNPMRQRSTLAHELGHVCLEDWVDGGTKNWSERTPQEIRADAFARHLLLPIDALREFAGEHVSDQATLSAVVQRFLVSPAIAAIAMRDAAYIDEATKRTWMNLTAPMLAARFGWSDHYHALQAESDQRRAPQRLLARAIRGYAEGVVSAQVVATLRGVPREAAEAQLRKAGVVATSSPVAWADPDGLPDPDVDLQALEADLGTSRQERRGTDAPPRDAG